MKWIQVEVYKEKVQSITRSKYENDEKVLKLTEELEKKVCVSQQISLR